MRLLTDVGYETKQVMLVERFFYEKALQGLIILGDWAVRFIYCNYCAIDIIPKCAAWRSST